MARILRAFTVAIPLAVSLASCGPRARAVPDINDQPAINDIVDELGTGLIYRRNQLPIQQDGTTFNDWVLARREYLAGKRYRCVSPRDYQPRTVGEAIAWERRVQDRDADNETACGLAEMRDDVAKERAETARARAYWTDQVRRSEEQSQADQRETADDMACIQRQHEMESQLADADKFAAWLAEHPCRGDPL